MESQLIIFDLDGTLIDSRADLAAGVSRDARQVRKNVALVAIARETDLQHNARRCEFWRPSSPCWATQRSEPAGPGSRWSPTHTGTETGNEAWPFVTVLDLQ